MPIKTVLDAAPKELLQIIQCSCKIGCASNPGLQKDAVVKSMEFPVQQLARNAKLLDVKMGSILIQMIIM